MKKHIWYLSCMMLMTSGLAQAQEQEEQAETSQVEATEETEQNVSTENQEPEQESVPESEETQIQEADETPQEESPAPIEQEPEPQAQQPALQKESPAPIEQDQEPQAQQPALQEESPTPIEQEPEPQAQPAKLGPETVQLSEEKIGFRGNWVKKREWLLRAKEQNNKIQTIIAEIQQLRPAFAEKFTTIQNQLDSFYRTIGNRIGNLQSSFKSFIGEEKRSNRDREPTIDEFDNIASFQRDLETIPKEVEPINKLDAALGERITKLDEQLQNARDEGTQAQKLYDEMWDMIDDTKAQSHFYEIKGITKKIKSIYEYIQGTFAQDFDATLSTTEKQIDEFQEKLLDLENTFKFIEQDEQERNRRRIISSRKKPTTAWHSAITKPFVEAYTTISSFIHSGTEIIGSWFKTTPKRKPPRRQAQPPEEKPSDPVAIPENVTIPQAEPQPAS